MSCSSLRALVVDDLEVISHMLEEYLERIGLRVECCSSGDEAWKRLAEERYHLVISDIQMPGMDGLQLAGLVDGLAPERRPAFIGMSGSHVQPDMEEPGFRQMQGFLAKPFTLEQVRAMCEEALGRPLPQGP
jgi:two-component system, sensor histidine kinase and response regulator